LFSFSFFHFDKPSAPAGVAQQPRQRALFWRPFSPDPELNNLPVNLHLSALCNPFQRRYDLQIAAGDELEVKDVTQQLT
jgi:hypothetical protein